MNNLRGNLSNLYDFYLVVKAGGFVKAAEENNISQPNLSLSVKNLESTLNLELIIRNNKGISLTNDGEELYKQLDNMFSSLKKYNNSDSAEEMTGTITIGTTRNIADYKLSQYLLSFNKHYPKVKIKILIDSANNLNDLFIQHKIDILIDYLPNINFSENLNLEIVAIDKFNTCFACSKKLYQLGAKNITKLSELNNYNLVIPGSSRRRQMLDMILQSKNIQLHPIIELPDSKLMGDLVNSNDYIGYFVEEEVKYYNLSKLDIQEQLPVNSIGMIYRKNTMNSITKNFVKIVLSNC